MKIKKSIVELSREEDGEEFTKHKSKKTIHKTDNSLYFLTRFFFNPTLSLDSNSIVLFLHLYLYI